MRIANRSLSRLGWEKRKLKVAFRARNFLSGEEKKKKKKKRKKGRKKNQRKKGEKKEEVGKRERGINILFGYFIPRRRGCFYDG